MDFEMTPSSYLVDIEVPAKVILLDTSKMPGRFLYPFFDIITTVSDKRCLKMSNRLKEVYYMKSYRFLLRYRKDCRK